MVKSDHDTASGSNFEDKDKHDEMGEKDLKLQNSN